MKKILAFVPVLAAVLLALAVFASCETPPPPPPPPAIEEPEDEPEPYVPEPLAEEGPVPMELSVRIWPNPFSPDGDGIDDEVNLEISFRGPYPAAGWSVVVRAPAHPYPTFFEIGGYGPPPSRVVWDGIGLSGELAHSATAYPVEVTVTDEAGETLTFEYAIRVDVMVRDEGGVLRVIVPSIMFAPNMGGFAGLAPNVMENNERVLRRIAEVLERFDGHTIRVEGHGNPTSRPGSATWIAENPRLIEISEERARTVLEHLVGLGVERERLSYVGVGGDRVLAEFDDRDEWWQNRRVEFVLEKR